MENARFPAVAGATMTKERCRGCYDDVYNGQLASECWSFVTATVVLKKEVHIDQRPPWTQPARELPSCYRARRFVYVRPDQER